MRLSDKKLFFEVPGIPRAKQRPRFTKQGTTYTPHQTVSYENLIKLLASEAVAKVKDWDIRGQFHLEVCVFLPIPKSRPKAWKELAERDWIQPTTRPDWDNYGKIVSDALNGIVWHDDSMVVSAAVQKFYTYTEPCMTVHIEDWTCTADRWIRKG